MHQQGPTELIRQSGISQAELARRAEIDKKTVMLANRYNRWPVQKRTRESLQKVLKEALSLTPSHIEGEN